MIEKQGKKITELNFKDGLYYAQWGLMRGITGHDCSYSEWQQDINKKPQVEQQKFWLEKPTEGQRISPVYGVVNKE